MDKLHILHLEDDADDAFLVRHTLERSGIKADIVHAKSSSEFFSEIQRGNLDLILMDHGVPGFPNKAAMEMVKARCPQVPVIVVSGAGNEKQVQEALNEGASDYVLKDHAWQLIAAIRRLKKDETRISSPKDLERQNQAMRRLVAAVQDLSLARTLEQVMATVRRAARELTGADGATFILRDNDRCHYADEDAIEPLWKGKKFPMSACISGWAMLNRQPAVIEDIYKDSRIPVEAYRPTFVKSLVMVPIRTESPIGAIGNYWAKPHLATQEEVELLQALANTTSVAMENVRVYAELEERVQLRTLELEAFSYSVSHDLRAPLRHVLGFIGMLEESAQAKLSETERNFIKKSENAARRMTRLIEDLLGFSRLGQVSLKKQPVNMDELVRTVIEQIQPDVAGRNVDWKREPLPTATGDANLLRQVWTNLVSNAVKYSRPRSPAVIEIGGGIRDNEVVYHVRDNGVGFDMAHAEKLFGVFKRLHQENEFEGTGIGLANVRAIIQRHGGRTWVEAKPDQGATFYFSLPKS